MDQWCPKVRKTDGAPRRTCHISGTIFGATVQRDISWYTGAFPLEKLAARVAQGAPEPETEEEGGQTWAEEEDVAGSGEDTNRYKQM